MGYYLRRNGKSLKLNRFQIIIGWTSAFAAGLFAMFGFYKSSFKGYVYNPVESASFNAFAPLLWVIFITWALLACINGYGGNSNFYFQPEFRLNDVMKIVFFVQEFSTVSLVGNILDFFQKFLTQFT